VFYVAAQDINKKGQGGQTPLMAAVLQGKTKNVVSLLKHNPDVTLGEKDGCT
jgi:ankyrin repeat protein